jgi:hypothetical protein
MPVISIDPGPPEKSALVVLSSPLSFTHWMLCPNEEILAYLRDYPAHLGHPLVIEKVTSHGMPMANTTLDTVFESGRFAEAYGGPVHRITRSTVRAHICKSMKANDSTVRMEILNRFGGGAAALGTVKNPGPLHGFSSDLWSAIALGITFLETR